MKPKEHTDKKSLEFKIGNEGSPSTVTDKEERVIWEHFRKGDEESLIYIYRRYADDLFNYGCQFSGRKEYLRDCIQELFCDLIDQRKKLSPVQSVKGYLFASLKRRILRGLKREEKVRYRDTATNNFEIEFSIKSVSLSQTFNKEDYAIIEKQLNTLPVLQREVILLHFYEGLSYREIAEIMGIKVKSARALTYRALESMAKKLSPYRGAFYTFFLHILG